MVGLTSGNSLPVMDGILFSALTTLTNQHTGVTYRCLNDT